MQARPAGGLTAHPHASGSVQAGQAPPQGRTVLETGGQVASSVGTVLPPSLDTVPRGVRTVRRFWGAEFSSLGLTVGKHGATPRGDSALGGEARGPRRRRLQAAVLTGPLPGCHEEDARLGRRPGSAHEPPASSSRRRPSSESSSSDGSGAEPAWGSEALCETPAPPSRHRPQRPHCHLRGPLGLGKPPRRGQTW